MNQELTAVIGTMSYRLGDRNGYPLSFDSISDDDVFAMLLRLERGAGQFRREVNRRIRAAKGNVDE